jgi:hypothetical protein
MQVKIKAGLKFVDLKTKKEIKISKVDLKGVYIEGLPNPVPLLTAVRSIHDNMWLKK